MSRETFLSRIKNMPSYKHVKIFNFNFNFVWLFSVPLDLLA
jgi:hypothetical protein